MLNQSHMYRAYWWYAESGSPIDSDVVSSKVGTGIWIRVGMCLALLCIL